MFNLMHRNRKNTLPVRFKQSPYFSLQNEINQLFEDFFDNGQNTSLLPSEWVGSNVASPAVDIIEAEKSFKVEAELPGMESDDIEVTINDNFLTIRGEKKEDSEEQQDNYIRRERYYGAYERTLSLPDTADAEKARASFNKGVLWVEIPKKASAVRPARKITVEKAA
jgi:HSP20 family protein